MVYRGTIAEQLTMKTGITNSAAGTQNQSSRNPVVWSEPVGTKLPCVCSNSSLKTPLLDIPKCAARRLSSTTHK